MKVLHRQGLIKMARTSRNNAITQKRVTDKKYKAALYIRLSNEDEDKDNTESNSVINQRMILKNFCDNMNDIEIYDYYVDDGYSGVNFNRPNFQRMEADIKAKNVNCVIVKDLSRLGRNYIEVGKYLDEYFPNNDIRFIAINDNIDKIGSSSWEMITPIKSLFNENYSRDISSKVTSAFRIKELQGQFIGAFASYGYQKDPKNKNHLIVDPIASKVVQKIFKLFLNGTSKSMIAKILNREKIPCPSEYKAQCGLNYNNGQRLELTKYWTYPTIHNILKNEIYTGTMVQHKNIRSDFNNKKSTITGKENWIKVKKTHEAIIDEDTFDKVQILMHKDTRQIDFQKNIHKFAGFVFCADCGRAMVKVSRHGKYDLICGTYAKLGKVMCSQHKIHYDVLEATVLAAIQNLIMELCDIESAVNKAESLKQTNTSSFKIEQQIQVLSQKLLKIQQRKKHTYEDYQDKIISKDDFIKYNADYTKDEEAIQNQIDTLNKNLNTKPTEIFNDKWFNDIKEYKNIQKLDRVTIATFIDRIEISEGTKIKIKFRNMDKIQMVRELQ